MREEGIPARKSVVLGEALAIFPGVVIHGIGHRYAGDAETGGDLLEKEWKSLVYPVIWPFLGAATLTSPENAALMETFDEATGITLIFPGLFVGTWIYDLIETPGRIVEHNRMVDRMWEVKKALDEAGFPEEIRLDSMSPGQRRESPLGVATRPDPDVEIAFRLDPLEAPVDLQTRLRGRESGEVTLIVDVPPEAPAGEYALLLWYGPPDVPLKPRMITVLLEVLSPEVKLSLGSPLSLEAKESGWIRGLVEWTYETPLDGSCTVTALPLKREGPVAGRPVEIDPAFDIRLDPRGDWDGETLEAGRTYYVEVAIYISPDLPDGRYTGHIRIEAAPQGHPPETVPYPVEVDVSH
jgi:hypothetical protein